MPKLQRRILLATAGAALTAPAIVRAQAQKGVALVIGNSKYQWEAQLPNVRRDAPDVAKRFQAMGLKVDLVQDLGRDAMRQAIDRFKAAAAGANFAALYFAGHGASWGQDTYVVPVDVDLGNPSVTKTLVPVREINAAAKGAANRLLVFDNCRNNPADGWRQLAAERGAGINLDKQRADTADADPNSLTIYSTAPGRVALDGPPGENSPFASAFLHQLASSIDLQALPSRLRRELLVATAGRQVVWDLNTYAGGFTLGGGAPAPGVTAGDPSRVVELPNAYAFARKNGLPLPEGLIAWRPPAGSAHAQKIGAFEFIAQSPVGPVPYLFIVLSVDDHAAQVVTSVHNDSGRVWRVVNGVIEGGRLSFQPNYARPNYLVDWSDANSGSVAQMGDRQKGGRGTVRSIGFKRLDG